MFLSGRMHRHVFEVARVLLLILAGGVFGFSVALTWVACSNPLELEVREGSLWLHVLASRAGVDIYDPFQVAFVNMAHGPLDPILKTWISRCMPSLPGHLVARSFVLISPLFFLGAAYSILRGRLTSSLFAAGGLYLFLAQTSLLVLVGRSDATAICFFCVAGVLTHQLLENPHWSWFERPHLLRQVGLGVLSSAVFLTSSRYLPAAAALQFVVLAARLPYSIPAHLPVAESQRLSRRLRFTVEQVAMGMLLFAAGVALVWIPIFAIELHGSFRIYWEHFFGFFSAESGWGTFAGSEFQLFPDVLLEDRMAPLLAFAALLLLACFRLRHQRTELTAWVTMLVIMWCALAYGYHKNQLAGGLHYFFEFFVFAWLLMLHSLSRRHPWGTPTKLSIFAVILLALPWSRLLDLYEFAHLRRTQARAFLAHVARITHGAPVFGEGTHLYKTQYRGEVVDSGDTVHAISATGYFGTAFTYTYQKYLHRLYQSPPRYVLAAVITQYPFRGIMTPTLQYLLLTRYRRVLVVPGSAFALGGSHALYELRANIPAPVPNAPH